MSILYLKLFVNAWAFLVERKKQWQKALPNEASGFLKFLTHVMTYTSKNNMKFLVCFDYASKLIYNRQESLYILYYLYLRKHVSFLLNRDSPCAM